MNGMGITREEAYEVLELPYGADQDAVRTSYKRLALKWHPDKHENSPLSTQKFQRISKAYKRLTDDDEEEEITMSMADMFDLFQHIFFTRAMGAFNGYGGYGDDSYEDDDTDLDYDDDDYDEDNIDYLSIFADKFRTKQDYRKGKNDNETTTRRFLTPEEIEKNAHELITEEEKEKKKAEKRRAKKKRRREKKKLEKQETEQRKKEPTEKNNQTQKETGAVENDNQKTIKKDKKSKDSSQSEEEDFDQNAAFFTKVINKKKKGASAVVDSQHSNQANSKSNKTKDKQSKQSPPLPRQQQQPPPPHPPQQNGQAEELNEDLDPAILRSRQLAIRGNQMANSGHYSPAIELFTEAIKLDPSDFRFFGNRSYCFDRMQQYEKALRDAEKAISLSSEWPKGYFRKGRALAGLKRYADAEQAFMQVIKLDRQCEDAMQELLRVRSHQLTEMGFSKEQADAAIRQHGTVQQALDSLLSGTVSVPENSLGSEVYVSDDDDHNRCVNNNNKPLSQSVLPPVMPLRMAKGGATVKMDPKNPEGLTALWVGNVLPEVSEKKLMAMFSKYGPVTSVRLLPEKFCAFINFKSKEGAGKAMAKLQGQECCGQRLLIKFPDNPITNGNVVIRKQTGAPPTTTSKTPKIAQPMASSLPLGAMVTEAADKQSGPVNGDECYFWRTTGCVYGNKCRWKHLPLHKGIDRKPWQKVK